MVSKAFWKLTLQLYSMLFNHRNSVPQNLINFRGSFFLYILYFYVPIIFQTLMFTNELLIIKLKSLKNPNTTGTTSQFSQ